MKTRYLSLTFAFACALTMHASPLFTTIPPSGLVAGAPGDSVGWGFSFTNDTAFFLLVDSSNFCEVGGDPGFTDCTTPPFGPTLGIYTDYIANNATVVAPNSTLVVSFDPNLLTGVGVYTINSNASVFATDSGNLFISFVEFQGDPFNGGTPVSGDIEISSAASVLVSPEPSTWGLAALGIAAFVARKLRS